MRKTISVLITVLIMNMQCFAAPCFSDVDESSAQGKAITRLYDAGIVNGVGNGRFMPDGTLTRAEFVKMVNGVFDYKEAGDALFSDVLETDWFYNDVRAAYNAGYIKGTGDGNFLPRGLVTREAACVMLNNILKMYNIPGAATVSDYVSDWARESVLTVVSNKLIEAPGGVFRGTEPMTRGEAALMLEKCLIDDKGTTDRIDLSNIAREELEIRMNRVINAMESNVIPSLKNEVSKIVARRIVANMKNYLADSSHDYKKASEETYEIYRTLSDADGDEFKEIVQKYNKLEDLTILYDFFFITK